MPASFQSTPRCAAQRGRGAMRAALIAGAFAGLAYSAHAQAPATAVTATSALARAERQALLALYARTAGPEWTVRTGWGGPAGTECSWHGVRCDEQQHVVALELANNGLRGRLPPLQALSRLQVLRVSLNHLQGALPPLAGLRELRVLTAHNNLLTGAIPPLQALPRLERVIVANNELSGPLPPLRGLTQLRDFDASNNRLSGIVPRLDGLDSLRRLDLSFNRLHGVASPGSLPASVDLEGNLIRGQALVARR